MIWHFGVIVTQFMLEHQSHHFRYFIRIWEFVYVGTNGAEALGGAIIYIIHWVYNTIAHRLNPGRNGYESKSAHHSVISIVYILLQSWGQIQDSLAVKGPPPFGGRVQNRATF